MFEELSPQTRRRIQVHERLTRPCRMERERGAGEGHDVDFKLMFSISEAVLSL